MCDVMNDDEMNWNSGENNNNDAYAICTTHHGRVRGVRLRLCSLLSALKLFCQY
jgi:hypothetical protein